jgi:ubiquitin C-terminal hydrolase
MPNFILIIEQVFHIDYRTRIALGVCGLESVNNNSFLNAVLQCLSNTIPLRNHIKSGKKHDSINNYYIIRIMSLQSWTLIQILKEFPLLAIRTNRGTK